MDWRALLVTSVEWIGITIAVVVALLILYRMLGAQEWGWQEYLKRLTLNNPVPMIVALGSAALAIVFFLLIKGTLMYLHRDDKPPEPEPIPSLSLPAPAAR